MTPAWGSRGGRRPSAVRARQAGVDMLGGTAAEQQVDRVLGAMPQARAQGKRPPPEGAYARLRAWGQSRPAVLASSIAAK